MGEMHFSELDQSLFGSATHYELYKKLGAHPCGKGSDAGVYFAVWAPHAVAVSVIGEFNDWQEHSNPCKQVGAIGVWEVFVKGAKAGDLYKFHIVTKTGKHLDKADPYARWAELRPGTASRIAPVSDFVWTDENWMVARREGEVTKKALAIYELHLGSWMKHPYCEDNEDGFYNYRELAKRLVTYILEMGYTHVELMGIAEHPLDNSWGYQVTGYYAPNSRHGTPADFRYLVNHLHKHNIGVILDWVPAHFPKDNHALADFDGEPLYEHPDPKRGEQPEWGTKVFNYGRNEVKNFLIDNALYWIEEFHIDGLRVDAVASMLYLNYGKEEGQWIPNKYGGKENLEAVEFFKHLNTVVLGRNQGTMMIAEESTDWPLVTGRPEDGGLGFTFKWNMGWMNDFLEYMKLDPYFKKFNHNKMTFGMTYAYRENYVLVLSHDEVVHLKCSMLSKMPGLTGEKFENLKAGYGYMIGHPGKKLLFMGQDFGQYQEWSEERELDWYLLGEEKHLKLKKCVADMLHLYRKYPALYANDGDPKGFSWINADDSDRSIFSFVRYSLSGQDNLLFIYNYTPLARDDYRVGVPTNGTYTLLLNSADPIYGGAYPQETREYSATKGSCDNCDYSIGYKLPPLSVSVFVF